MKNEEDDDCDTKDIATIDGFTDSFKRKEVFKIDCGTAEAAVERIKDYVEAELPTFQIFESEEGYKVLVKEKAEDGVQIEFEVIRQKEDGEFQYYAIASKINGDLLTFKNIMAEARA